jgi:hypothetical protein
MSGTQMRTGFDASLAGKWAECDGGGLVSARLAAREDFAGTLTGEYVDHGDPPWRWYLMAALTTKPDGYLGDTVWCESGSLWVVEGEASKGEGV